MAELTRRYVVMAMAAAAPFDPADRDASFVLKPWKDPSALIALKSYRDHCYPELARDLDEWIRLLEAGPLSLGGVGRRNEAHLTSIRLSAAPRGRPRGHRARRTTVPTRPNVKAKARRSPARPSRRRKKRGQ
jgi:hypothetical protein